MGGGKAESCVGELLVSVEDLLNHLYDQCSVSGQGGLQFKRPTSRLNKGPRMEERNPMENFSCISRTGELVKVLRPLSDLVLCQTKGFPWL